MYPFRIKHLGKSELYTLYAPSAQNRQDWCEAIIEAKTRHAASLYLQNAEPFRLRVLADTAFGYEGAATGNRSIVIKGTPLDRAIKEAESRYEGQARPGPVCRAAVNCATVFHQPYGRLMCAIGTDYGVYISEYENPRGWTRVSFAVDAAQGTYADVRLRPSKYTALLRSPYWRNSMYSCSLLTRPSSPII